MKELLDVKDHAAPRSETGWFVENRELDRHRLGQFNSAFAVTNGYLSLKGNVLEERDGYCPVTLINGLYDELDMFSLLPASNRERPWLDSEYFDTAGKSPAVANLPNPLHTRIFVGAREISLFQGVVREFHQELDLSCGLYRYAYVFEDVDGRQTRLSMERFVTLEHAHRGYLRLRVAPLNHQEPIRICCGVSGAVHSNMTRERQCTIDAMETPGPEHCILRGRAPARDIRFQIAALNRVAGKVQPTDVAAVVEHDTVQTQYVFTPTDGDEIVLERAIVAASSEDARHGVAVDFAEECRAAGAVDFETALTGHRSEWKKCWERADVRIDGDELGQTYLRFCIYHLVAAAPRFSDRLSVPVKLLSGDYYQGNTFYDTETYIIPFYSFVMPEMARTCIRYRYAGLDSGRAIARSLDCAGAKFAWQSGPYGEECLGRWYHFTHTNIHINGDVCWSLMHYYWITQDHAFMLSHGLELLVESARFYATRARYDAQRDAYDIHDVSGPDEAHCHSTNNYFTNYLARRTLRWAAEMLEHCRSEASADVDAVVRRLDLGDDEPQRWQDVAEKLTFIYDPETKLIEQCDGFHELPPPPQDILDGRKDWFVPLAWFKALNQPDVIMAMVMFRDAFEPDVKRANWDYYDPKSMNFSSMSFVLNSMMAADLGLMKRAHRDFIISAGMDVDEALTGRRDTFAGLHGTAMGGAWMAAVLGFGGVHIEEHALRINPNLPAHWKRMEFTLVLGGVPTRVAVTHDEVHFEVEASDCAEWRQVLRVNGREVTLESGRSLAVKL